MVDHLHDWREATHYLQNNSLEELFGDRITSLSEVLNFVRFALMPPPLLLEVIHCLLVHYIFVFRDLKKKELQNKFSFVLVFLNTDAILLPWWLSAKMERHGRCFAYCLSLHYFPKNNKVKSIFGQYDCRWMRLCSTLQLIEGPWLVRSKLQPITCQKRSLHRIPKLNLGFLKLH